MITKSDRIIFTKILSDGITMNYTQKNNAMGFTLCLFNTRLKPAIKIMEHVLPEEQLIEHVKPYLKAKGFKKNFCSGRRIFRN